MNRNGNRPRKLLLMLSAVIVALSCFPSQASAYSLTGQKMNSQLWYRPFQEFLPETRESFRAAMSTWNARLPEWRRLCFDNTSHNLTSYPSKDSACRIYKTYSGGQNYLAQNSWWYTVSTGNITESDVDINANYSWVNGTAEGRYDVRSVFLHEMGHTVGLNHSNSQSAVMYAYSYPNVMKRSLTQDDINGVNAIY